MGDKVFLKVSPMKGVKRTSKRNKLDPRYVGPFEILDGIGPVAYRLALPPDMERMYNLFHVSQLRKYIPDPNHIISYQPLQLQEDMTYIEEPIQILNRKEKQLGNKLIPLVKILWRSQQVEEATCELEEEMRKNHPHLFQGMLSFEDETFLKRVEL